MGNYRRVTSFFFWSRGRPNIPGPPGWDGDRVEVGGGGKNGPWEAPDGNRRTYVYKRTDPRKYEGKWDRTVRQWDLIGDRRRGGGRTGGSRGVANDRSRTTDLARQER